MKKFGWLLALLFSFQSVGACAQDSLQQVLEAEMISELADEAVRFGNPERGAFVFFRPEMNCARCHELSGSGRRLGPALDELREIETTHLVESLLHPSKDIKKGFESVLVSTIDGDLISGILVQESESELVIDRIEEPEQPRTIEKDDIVEWKKLKQSSMPDQLVNQLSDRQEFLDLISYLNEIAKNGSARATELKPDSSYFVSMPLPEYESRVDHRKLIDSLNRDSFERGAEIYRLRCESCHGTRNKQGSMPTSLRFSSGRFKNGGDPYAMYQTLTHGYGMMNAQRWMVPKQKYDVIHYIREHFVKAKNKNEYKQVSTGYLRKLPAGNTLGPEPKINRPWSDMDYGPSLNNTVEISNDGSNIAQKGIVIRLDAGPGGVESGKNWIVYDHDTMRVAGAWSDEFIDYNGIHFNGVHGRHPKAVGTNWIVNSVGPGWGRPGDLSFTDQRVEGRDGKMYGPLPRTWMNFKGLYRFGQRTLLDYTVGECSIVESPLLKYQDDQPYILRQFNIGPRDRELMIQLISTDLAAPKETEQKILIFGEGDASKLTENLSQSRTSFDGTRYAQTKKPLNMTNEDFTIYAEIRSGEDGTIFSQTKARKKWVKNGKTFFIRDGRLHYDIGWVGVVDSDIRVDGEGWQKVALIWDAKSGHCKFYVNGEIGNAGQLSPEGELSKAVQRIGFTNDDFPESSPFIGDIRNVRFFSRCLTDKELNEIESVNRDLKAEWDIAETDTDLTWINRSNGLRNNQLKKHGNVVLFSTLRKNEFDWVLTDDGHVRMRIAAGEKPLRFSIGFSSSDSTFSESNWQRELARIGDGSIDLGRMMEGGAANWPQVLTTKVEQGKSKRGFQVDVLKRPVQNPWNDRMRLTGIDFFETGTDAIVCCWDGTVYRVNGIDERSTSHNSTITWRRIAAGLFQPLGVRIVDGKIYVSCRDQIVRLHDLNNDGEMDWYENFNSDHQVTEHFHEFAMGLQTDDDGNFYYAKSARHALKAIVPHHGTLLKVSKDGMKTEILATGFRAANGVCLNPDGSFIVTDQEGHWNPKNRINWVQQGGFYGNMYGYHNVTDSSNDVMDQPLCWITNAFDRSPGELLWVTSDKWKSLKGSLLNLSYGMGQIFIVPHENIGGQMQGGMCAFPMSKFPTGIMRGRFHPIDGQLYCCGMFAWAGNQHQPGGLYRVRYIDESVHLPVGLNCSRETIKITFSDELDAESASDSRNFKIETWDLKRTKNYGSDHYNVKNLKITHAKLLADDRVVELTVPRLESTWCMKIKYSVRDKSGNKVSGEIHNTIHELSK